MPVVIDKPIQKDTIQKVVVKQSPSSTTQEAIDTNLYIDHEVMPSQTLFGIAKQYNCKVDSVKVWNATVLIEGLKIGQHLKIRKAIPVSAEAVAMDVNFIIHEVGTGESMYAIARKYNVSVTEILKANNKTDYSLSAGQKIKIPKK